MSEKPSLPCKVLSMYPTGSRYIVEPPVTDTDDDWLVLVPGLDEACNALEKAGWTSCLGNGDPYRVEQGLWPYAAFRNGEVNVVVTHDTTMYLRSIGATLIAKELNLKEKEDRIALFRCLRFDHIYGGPLP